MSDLRFEFSPRFFDQALNSEQMGSAMEQSAQRGSQHAHDVSPFVTGEYAGNFRVERRKVGDRAGAVLENVSDYAAEVEWTLGYHPLGQALAKMEADSK